LLWPAIIWILYKARINLVSALLCLALISFSINIFSIQSDPITTFYSPLSRFWELLVGALWACISVQKSLGIKHPSQFILNLLSCVGLLTLGIAIFGVNSKNLFPGWWALLPTIGAVLLISANTEASVNKLFLSHHVMVWLGVISYPLYLWHWVLLSFGQIISAGKLSDFYKIILILIAIGLAYLTNKYWESIFRYKGKKVALLLILLMGFIGYQGWSVYVRDGLDFRHKYVLDLHGGRPQHTDKECLKKFAGYEIYFCRLSYIEQQNIETVLIGDSIAHNHFSGLKQYYLSINKSFAMVGWPGTQPLIKENHEINYSLETVHKMNKLMIGLAQDKSVKTVILGMRETDFNTLQKAQLERTFKFLNDNGKQVIFISPPPHLTFDPIECTGMPPFRPTMNKECIQDAKDIHAQYFISRIELKEITKNFNIQLFDTYQQICIEDTCPIKIEGGLLYRNKGYLSVTGSMKVFKNFTE
jgi:hypothetical protein